MSQLTLTEFKQKYFYKTELQDLCRQYGLPTSGTKAELNSYLEAFLSGIPRKQIKPARKKQNVRQLAADEITLTTPIVNSGFSFNDASRQFFAEYFHVDHFSFKKEMAIIKRAAEARHDTQMTIGDLIAQYQDLTSTKQSQQLVSQTAEENTYQWNNFVRAFCQDTVSQEFDSKLKVAAILWQHVKSSTKPKKFTPNLVEIYAAEINQFRKK
ncbi:SAP domain-containing protein [Lactobacillus sp. ESL0677]|uniref:SAP domain-containing protein n=1 Tax=Lactobacillus sp. ESL0677 TaxID=2983208 RepID=UPI0023F7031A|nr:SAP domain-containing protein [Lactobacillus sp. ESL0677]WEV36368.1 SAP domain-containing protein [Lactobacillus sp. ESL0677]